MNKILTFVWCCAALLLASCDSGNIHEEMVTTTREGLTVRMTGRLRGAESWSDRYQVVLAAFADGSDYTLVQKEIPSQLIDGDSVCRRPCARARRHFLRSQTHPQNV